MYKKADANAYDNINFEAQSVAKKLDLGDKVECLAKKVAFITLKDHKPDFTNNPKCRLINPAKPELGKVSKKLLEKINNTIRKTTKLQQWHSSDNVITWFKNIHNKRECIFVQFDIEEFYPSISENLAKSLSYPKEFIKIINDEENIIIHARKSLLFTYEGSWIKKTRALAREE